MKAGAAANDATPAAAPSAPPEVLTIAELAELLRMNPKSLHEIVARGDVPGCRKVGSAWRVHRPTVVAWLAEGQFSAPPKRKAGRR